MKQIFLVLTILFFLISQSRIGHASVVSSSVCFVKAEVIGAVSDAPHQGNGSGPKGSFLDLEILEVSKRENCSIEKGQVYRAIDNYPGILKKGDRINASVSFSSSMGPDGPVGFLQWSELSHEDGSFVLNTNGVGIANLQSGQEPINLKDPGLRRLSQPEIQYIGAKVFENECASNDDNLINWNEGENFLSLGIGHFIWYPRDTEKLFDESFLEFLEYAKSSGERLPDWLDIKPFPACPWKSRDSFLKGQSNAILMELRGFLLKTKPLQSAFIVRRLKESLPLMLKEAAEGEREKVALRFHLLASIPKGVYLLADYINFKGLGILGSERYHGKGWGLLQVLEGMSKEGYSADLIEEFVRSANNVLEARVENAPLERNEKRWLPGWKNRINSYLDDF
jgi:hypothetical protein